MLSIYNFNAKLTIVQRSDGAQSWHVYGNFACTIRTMKYLTKHVSKYIDKQVYKNNTSLWMCNTFKKNKTNEDITRNCYPIDEVNFPNTLLNNVDQLFLL